MWVPGVSVWCEDRGGRGNRRQDGNRLLDVSVTLPISMVTHSHAHPQGVVRCSTTTPADTSQQPLKPPPNEPLGIFLSNQSIVWEDTGVTSRGSRRVNHQKTHFPIILLCLPLKRPLFMNRGAAWRALMWRWNRKTRERNKRQKEQNTLLLTPKDTFIVSLFSIFFYSNNLLHKPSLIDKVFLSASLLFEFVYMYFISKKPSVRSRQCLGSAVASGSRSFLEQSSITKRHVIIYQL